MRDLNWNNFYDPLSGTLHANWVSGFFSNCSTALWAVTDLASDGIAPKRIVMDKGWDFFCDRKTHPDLDLYPILFDVRASVGPVSSSAILRINQHRRYALSKIELLLPFLEHWFSPSKDVQEITRKFITKYRIDCKKIISVVYRGTDKHTEVQVSDAQSYLDLTRFLLEKYSDHRIVIQTDQLQVRDLFLQEFGEGCFAFDEMPVNSGNSAVHSMSEHELGMSKLDFAKTFLAVSTLLSKSHILVNHTGNTALWLALYRGHTQNMFQFDELGNISNPDGSNFSKNPLIVAYRKIKGALRSI